MKSITLRPRNRDKLDRWRTTTIAVLTLKADVPFWCTLTARESRDRKRHGWYLVNREKRRALREFVRSLCK